jgi:hypothetical protein
MVRKQLYIDDVHEQLLKRRAAERGVSEAQVVREALDVALREVAVSPPRAAAAGLDEFTRSARRLAKGHRLASRRFRRDAIYDERLGR